MRPRYLILLATRIAPDTLRLASATGLALAIERPGMVALTSEDCACYGFGDTFALGTLYPRFGPATPLSPSQVSGAVDDSPQAAERELLRRFYGGYVALHSTRDGTRVLRDPSGALACYYAETPNGFALASDVDLLLACGLPPPAVNSMAVLRHFYLRGLPGPETCLQGVDELLPGFALDVSVGAIEQRMRWSPWDHVAIDQDAANQSVEDQLRRVVRHSVAALTARYDRLLLSVSGGLDSSIIAACLARSGRDVRCVTMFTDEPSGDERVHARALCDHLRLPLIERVYRIADVDLDVAISPHLPRPIGRTLAQSFERNHLEVAVEEGMDAFVTGNGGDNVFGFSQSAAPVADYYLMRGVRPGLVRTIADVCRQSEVGPLEVLRAAVRVKRRGYRWTPGPMFLDAGMIAALAPGYLHQPWLTQPPGTPPGKAAHIAALLRVQQLLEPGRSRFAPVVTPLLAQPVIEACLPIPSWQWRTRGRDRAVARDAFAGDLPAAIVGRRSKAGPDAFSALILRHHRQSIRDRLLDGALARNHIVDRAALEARFRSEQPFTGEEQSRLLDLVDTEAWIGAWERRGRAVSRPGRQAEASGLPSV